MYYILIFLHVKFSRSDFEGNFVEMYLGNRYLSFLLLVKIGFECVKYNMVFIFSVLKLVSLNKDLL